MYDRRRTDHRMVFLSFSFSLSLSLYLSLSLSLFLSLKAALSVLVIRVVKPSVWCFNLIPFRRRTSPYRNSGRYHGDVTHNNSFALPAASSQRFFHDGYSHLLVRQAVQHNAFKWAHLPIWQTRKKPHHISYKWTKKDTMC